MQFDGNRYYPVSNITIPHSVLQIMISWTKGYPFNSIIYDDRFVQLLLLQIYNLEDLADVSIDETVLQFIRGISY